MISVEKNAHHHKAKKAHYTTGRVGKLCMTGHIWEIESPAIPGGGSGLG